MLQNACFCMTLIIRRILIFHIGATNHSIWTWWQTTNVRRNLPDRIVCYNGMTTTEQRHFASFWRGLPTLAGMWIWYQDYPDLSLKFAWLKTLWSIPFTLVEDICYWLSYMVKSPTFANIYWSYQREGSGTPKLLRFYWRNSKTYLSSWQKPTCNVQWS